MWNVVICDGDETEREQLLGYVRRFSSERRLEIRLEACAGWPELYASLEHAEPDVIIIAQDGVEGLNTVTNIHLPPSKFIWFSNLDFSMQAYRLCLPWFGSKPVTYQKMTQALTRCIGTEAGDPSVN